MVVVSEFILALFSIFFGYFASDLFVGLGSDFFGNSIFIHPDNINIIEAEFSLPLTIKLLPAILSLFGALIAIYLYHVFPATNFLIDLTNSFLGREIYTFLNGKYLFDVVYNKYIISKGLQLGYIISKVLDRGVIELIGPYGLSNVLSNTALNISKLDTGVITTYSLYITLGLLSLLFLVFAPLLLDTSLFSTYGPSEYATIPVLHIRTGTETPPYPYGWGYGESTAGEIRLFIIYLASLVIVLIPSYSSPRKVA